MKWLKAEGYYPLKMHGSRYMLRGLPDIHCCAAGRCMWLEVKRPGEVPTRLQLIIHERLRAAGCNVHVVRSLEEVKRVLKGGDHG